jgi:hypothetical protein
MGAPQAQQLQSSQQLQQGGASGQQVAQSRDAPVYADAGYGANAGYSSAGQGGYPAAAASSSYGVPSGGYGGAAGGAAAGGYGGAAGGAGQPGGNTGYYYYYYPVQEQKEQYIAPKESYQATDSYGIDPLGIIAVLAVAGLVIAGLALLFPGWAYVRSDENVYYRGLDGMPSFLGMNKDDYRALTSLVLTAIEGEDCMDKMMCDASKLVKRVKKADSYLKFMEELAPTSVSNTIKKLRTAMKKGDECTKSVTCAKKKVL